MVLEADNIIFAEVAAGLYLDDMQRDFADVFEPVQGAERDIGRLVFGQDSSSSPRMTFAVPCTTTQCSARWWCFCSDSFAPGFTVMCLTCTRWPLWIER